MEKVITTAMLVIASLVAAIALINAVLPATGKSAGALAAANSEAAKRIKSDIDIIYATGDTSGTITVWVKNVGTQIIRSVKDSGIIIEKPNGAARLSYVDGCSSECWDFTLEDSASAYLSNLCWNQIDGRYAAMTKDLAMVVGAATYKDLGQTYRNTSVDRSALDRLMELTSGVRVSAHVPAPATNRQDAVIRRGMSTTAVAPVWEGITIIPDEVTKAGQGQIVITAVMLFAMKVLRTGAGLVKQGTDHS